MIVSKLLDTVRAEIVSVNFAELAKLITDSDWAPATFTNNYRKADNFQSTDIIALDIDDGCSIENAQLLFSPYKYIIAPTKSHKVEKNGKICDRFRVVLVLSSPISDAATYLATWHRLYQQFPFIDKACKDPSRFFYRSTSVHAVKTNGLTIDLVAPAPALEPERTASSVPTGAKGKLSRATMEFMLNGAEDGQWNISLFKAAKDYHEQGYGEDEFIEKAERITGTLDHNDLQTIGSAFKKVPKYEPRANHGQDLVTLINRCHLYINSADITDTRLIDHDTGKIHNMEVDAIRMVLGKDAFNMFMSMRSQVVHFTYEPHKKERIIPTGGIPMFNEYQEAPWRLLDVAAELPKVHEDFLRHLTNGDEASFNYLLDWLALSLTGRNLTILCALGVQGVGKGILGSLMQKLHGPTNFNKVRDSVFKAKFNAQLFNKTLIYVDEAVLDDRESVNRIKDIINDLVEIERKGMDAITINNHSSYYLSSNDLSAIKIEASDRRFSIIDLTDTPLRFTPYIKTIDAIMNDNNVAALGNYLLSRELESDMLNPFVSARTKAVLEEGLAEWEAYIIQDLAPTQLGKEPMTLAALGEEIMRNCGLRSAPGRTKIKHLCERFPKVLRFKTMGQKRYIEFLTRR